MTSGSDAAISMLAAALEKEEKGQEFYREASEKSSNPLGKEFFKSLMAEEGIHIRRIKRIYTHLSGGTEWTDEWKALKMDNADLQRLTRDRIKNLGSQISANSSDLDALNIAIEMEQGAIIFYEEQAAQAKDSLEKEFVMLMMKEERGHYAALKEIKLFFTDPESYYIESERVMLDG